MQDQYQMDYAKQNCNNYPQQQDNNWNNQNNYPQQQTNWGNNNNWNNNNYNNYGNNGVLNNDQLAYQDDQNQQNGFGFSEKELRKGFIRKVFGILSAQLLLTTGFVVISCVNEQYQLWMHENNWLLWVCFALNFITYCMINCCNSYARQVPKNYIVCFIFTLTMSYMVGAITSVYNPETVVEAAGLTTAITIVLSLYAVFSDDDMTICVGVVLVLSVVLFIMIFLVIFIGGKTLNMIYSSLAAIMFGIYLIIDIKMVVRRIQVGGVSVKYGYDDYIIAAVQIYYDIIDMFLEILSLLGDN